MWDTGLSFTENDKADLSFNQDSSVECAEWIVNAFGATAQVNAVVEVESITITWSTIQNDT